MIFKKMYKVIFIFWLMMPHFLSAQRVLKPDDNYPKDGLLRKEKAKVLVTYHITEKTFVRIVDSAYTESETKETITPTTYVRLDSVRYKKVGDPKMDSWVQDTVFISCSRIIANLKTPVKDSLLKVIAYKFGEGKMKINFFGRNLGFIHSNENLMFRTDDGGLTWNLVFTNLNSNAYLYMFDNLRGITFAQTEEMRFYRKIWFDYSLTKDGGKTWEKRSKKASEGIEDISFNCTEKGDVVVVLKTIGSKNGKRHLVYQSKDFGEKFKRLK